MSRNSKLISIVLTLMLCMSMCVVSVWAVGEYGDSEYTDITDEPVYTEDPAPSDPTTTYEPQDSTDPTYTEDTEPSYDPTDTTDYTEAPSETDEYTTGYTYDTQDYTNYTTENSYVGGGQTYTVPETTAPSAALYDVKGEVDGKELNSNDWKDIALKLKNANSADDDDDDFSFIKNNNSTADNGEWLLIGGIVCLILSAGGIGYIIYTAVKRKKELAAAGGKPSSNSRYAVAGASAGRKGRDDYGDGFKSSSKKNNRANDKSKFDTADVSLKPNQTRYKNGNRRYK